ncbi:MAG: cytochrome-c peroxidase, partial [Cellvibrionaceae bacterium]|nr:cytochrome-c peroxidase [Cellvibrionaceae bacterium]
QAIRQFTLKHPHPQMTSSAKHDTITTMTKYKHVILALLIIYWAPLAIGSPDPLLQRAQKLFAPLPAQMPSATGNSPAKITLGRALFFETALSINHSQSCNSCHDLTGPSTGVDNQTTSLGALGKPGRRNSPRVWNAGLHIAQFWDGRSADLVAQAKLPILNPLEMALPDEATF